MASNAATSALFYATKSQVVTPGTAKIVDAGAAGPTAGKVIRSRAISVDVAGTIQYKDEFNNTRVTGTLAVGILHPISTSIILAGSTATGIVIYW